MVRRDSWSPDSFADDLSAEMLRQFSMAAMVSLWLLLVLVFLLAEETSVHILWPVMIAIVLCGCAHYWYTNRLISPVLLFSSLVVCAEVVLPLLAPHDSWYYYFVPVFIMSVISGRTWCIVSSCVIAALMFRRAVFMDSEPPEAAVISVVWLILTVAPIAWATHDILRTSTQWAWGSYVQAQAKRAEAEERRGQLLQLATSLEEANRRLHALNRSLDVARSAAEEARLAKARFAASVSHELRTPLNLIIGFSDVLLSAPEFCGEVSLSPAYTADVMTISRNAKHLQSLINDVLDLSQLETATMVIQPELCDLNAIIREVAASAEGLFTPRGLELTLELGENLPSVSVDRTRLRQVLVNLLANASRFTHRGGVTVRTRAMQGELECCIADTGVGIPTENLARVFEPFWSKEHQANEGNTSGGAGLGLAISSELVRLHGGRMWVESAPGTGTTFSFTLPLPNTGVRYSRLTRTRHEPAESPSQPGSVVVVSDDALAAASFARHFALLQVSTARSLEEATQVAQDGRLGLAILDTAYAESEGRSEHRCQLSELGVPLLMCPMSARANGELSEGTALSDAFLEHPIAYPQIAAVMDISSREASSVLIYDPEPDTMRLIERLVRQVAPDAAIAKAYSPGELLDMAKGHRPDVLFVDAATLTGKNKAAIQGLRQVPRGESSLVIAAIDAADTSGSAAASAAFTLLLPARPTLRETARFAERLVCLIQKGVLQGTAARMPEDPAD